MAVREFDASSADVIDLDVSTELAAVDGSGAFTIAAIVKLTDSGDGSYGEAGAPFWSGGSGNNNTDGIALECNGDTWYLLTSNDDFVAVTGTADAVDNWVLIAVSKASGTVTPRWHQYDFAAESWDHGDASGGTIGNSSGVVQLAHLGQWSDRDDSGDFIDGRLAIVAVWSSTFSDAESEAELESSASDWLDSSPVGQWRLNQDSTSTAVTDDTDNEADQSGISGTNVVTDDDPPGFDFSLTGGQDVTPAAVTVEATPGTLTVAAGAVDITPQAVTVDATPGTLSMSVDVPLVGPTVEATPGTMSVAPGTVDIIPDPVTVNATPGTVTVETAAGDQDVTPDPVIVDATPGTLSMSMDVPLAGADVQATPGTVALSLDVPLAAPTVDVSPGAVTIATDDGAQTVTPDPVTVTATPGTLTIDTGAVDITPAAVLLDATPGTLALALGATLTGPTVEATPGTVTVAVGAATISPEPVTVQAAPGTVSIVGGDTSDPNPISLTFTESASLSLTEAAALAHTESASLTHRESA